MKSGLIAAYQESLGDEILSGKQRSVLRLLLRHPLFSQSTTEKHVDVQQEGWQTGSGVQGSLLERVMSLELKKSWTGSLFTLQISYKGLDEPYWIFAPTLL